MSVPERAITYRLVERNGPAGRRILIGGTANRRELIVIGGLRGRDWPEALGDLAIEAQDAASGRWRVTSDAGSFDFEARAVDRIELRPELYAPLHRPFSLTGMERIAARVLLVLLRLPGGARLLRRWHARRSA